MLRVTGRLLSVWVLCVSVSGVAGFGQDAPVVVDRGGMAIAISNRVQPQLTGDAVGVTGEVIVAVKISKTGKVLSAIPISGPGALEPAVAAAVKQYTYYPYMDNGVPVDVQTTVKVVVEPPGKATRVPGGVMAGYLMNRVNPDYPVHAKLNHIQGVIILHGIIGKDGHVKRLDVITGPGELQGAAYQAVKQWVYRPYLLNGEPTEIDTTITINFQLGASVVIRR